MRDPLVDVLLALHHRQARFVLIGVWGVNLYAHSGSVLFETRDRDLFLPLDPTNLLKCWSACEAAGMQLWAGNEPLDLPRDEELAQRVVALRALVRATNQAGLDVDLTLVMAGFDFETVWNERRVFVTEGVDIPVARLMHIVRSKEAAGRDKDRLFLSTHAEALRQLLEQRD